MFEIRVICEPGDTDRVSRALAAAFDTGPARTYPTRDCKRTRLYVTAEHLPEPEPEPWPTPDEAYTLAPSIVSEIGWTARAAADRPFYDGLNRVFWLRKAAVLDRIALSDEADSHSTDAADLAKRAAERLVELDGTDARDPRGYVRREYARYTHTHTEGE